MEFPDTRSRCGLARVKGEGLPAADTLLQNSWALTSGTRVVERTFLGFTPLLKLKNSLAQPEMWRDLDKEVCSQHEH